MTLSSLSASSFQVSPRSPQLAPTLAEVKLLGAGTLPEVRKDSGVAQQAECISTANRIQRNRCIRWPPTRRTLSAGAAPPPSSPAASALNPCGSDIPWKMCATYDWLMPSSRRGLQRGHPVGRLGPDRCGRDLHLHSTRSISAPPFGECYHSSHPRSPRVAHHCSPSSLWAFVLAAKDTTELRPLELHISPGH